jgi:hypothetical protein
MRLLGIVLGSVGLVAAIGYVSACDNFFRPVPPLAAGLFAFVSHDDADSVKREVIKRILFKSPLGSSEAALKVELAHEGFGPVVVITDEMPNGKWMRGWKYVQYRRQMGLMTYEVTTIMWNADDNGRLLGFDGGFFRSFAGL